MNTRLILILASLLWLISCNKGPEEDVYVSLDHSQWFKYEEGDTLIFKNSTSAIDTYLIDRVATFYIMPGTEYTHYEVLEVNYKNNPLCNNCPISGFMRSFGGVTFYGNLYSSVNYHSGGYIN